jgi:hypothetical protein
LIRQIKAEREEEEGGSSCVSDSPLQSLQLSMLKPMSMLILISDQRKMMRRKETREDDYVLEMEEEDICTTPALLGRLARG